MSHHKPFTHGPRRRPRILFVGEAVSLAHVGRPAVLAGWAREAGCDVHFACGPLGTRLAHGEGLEALHLPTIDPRAFHSRLQRGRFFYTLGELEAYVAADRRLIAELKPDLVVGDFRLSLPVAVAETGTPLLTLLNAYWSPHRDCELLAPHKGLFRCLPGPLRDRLFSALKPLALRRFARPLDRLRHRHGLDPQPDFRRHFAAGTWCAYTDHPDLVRIDAVPEDHFHLGPVVWQPRNGNGPRLLRDLNAHNPLIYVSSGLGSVDDLLIILRGLCDLDAEFAVSGPSPKDAARLTRSLPRLAARSVIAPLFDPREVLSRAKLTVCHGGSGTLYQSLARGVPVLALPRNSDQFQASRAVERQGAGLLLQPHQVSAGRIASTVNAMLREEAFREKASRLARTLAHRDTRGHWLAFLDTGPAFAATRVVRREESAKGAITPSPQREAPHAPRRSPSAVSRAPRNAVRARNAERRGVTAGDEFRVRVASDPAARLRAGRLAYRVYRESGLAAARPDERMLFETDARPDTLVLLAENEDGIELGTVTLVFDGSDGLPCDEIFGSELVPLRVRGHRLAEVTRLALARRSRMHRMLLARLFNHISVYARRVAKSTDFVIEVNPRHTSFYERSLLFHGLSTDRACPRVNGALARLLRLDLQIQARACRRISEAVRRGQPARDRTFYRHFIPYDAEDRLARALVQAQGPQSTRQMCAVPLQADDPATQAGRPWPQ